MFVRVFRYASCALLLGSLPLFSADKPKNATGDVPAWEQPQPAVEKVDLAMYGRIREEGLRHSHIMEYASALADDIGPRLTGSPNLSKAMPGPAISSPRWAAQTRISRTGGSLAWAGSSSTPGCA